MKFSFRKIRQFNSRSYNLDLVKDSDEFYFLVSTLTSFYDTNIIKDLKTVNVKNIANIHVETNNKTLIKWLIKFGFEEA